MAPHADIPTSRPDRAECLRRLADRAQTVDAARSLWSLALAEIDDRSSSPQADVRGRARVAREFDHIIAAATSLSSEVDILVPAWIARFLEQLEAMHQSNLRFSDAIRDRKKLPRIDLNNMVALKQLQNALQAVGDRIDPHVGPIVRALGTLDQDVDHDLLAVLEYAGPAVVSAVPKLMEILRTRGITRWPSHLARAIANASRFDDGLLDALSTLLSSHEDHARHAAIEVLGTIGLAARPAAGRLLELFSSGGDDDRSRVIYALSSLGEPMPEFLNVLEAALGDDNGYVRRAAAHAHGKLTPEPDRFAPALIAACDFEPNLHHESLPEAAVAALGRYGPRALAALPRLRQFIEGPLKGRTVPVALVHEAIERISEHAAAARDTRRPHRRTGPVAEDESLFAVRHHEKQCYIDRLGRIAIQTRFASGQPFSDGRAIVHDDAGQTFVIDRDGRDVFRSEWKEIQPFSEGLAAVSNGDKCGFVDRDGRVIIEPQYDSVTAFSEGLAGFEVGRSELSVSTSISWTRPGLKGFIDRSGAVVIPAEWADASRFREGLVVVCTGGVMKPNAILGGHELLSDRKYGYIDRAARIVIRGEYDSADSFSEGLAVVRIGSDCRRSRYGYIDVAGNRIIPLTLTWALVFKEGLALVRRRGRKSRGKTFAIDRTGHVVLEVPYPGLQPFSEGLAAARSGETYGFINIHGAWVIEPQFDWADRFENGLAAVQRGDWYGLIDQAGNFIWGPTTEGPVNRTIEMEWSS